MKEFWKRRITSKTLWVAIIALVLTTTGIEPETLTSWDMVAGMLYGLITNPYKCVTFLIALWVIINNPTTKGIGD